MLYVAVSRLYLLSYFNIFHSLNTMVRSNKTKLDWFMFSYILLVLLTRQVPYHQVFSYGATALLLIIFLTRKLLYESNLHFPPPLIVCTIWFYLAAIFVSLLFSCYLVEGARQLTREIFFFIIFFIIYDYIRSENQWRTVVQALIWSGGLAVISVLVEGVLLFLSGEALSGADVRISGVFTNPNVAGLLISVCFPVAIGFLQWKQSLQRKRVNIYMWFVALSTIAAAILTVSRGLFLGFFFSMIALNLDIIWKVRYKLLLITCSMLFIAIVFGIIFIDSEMITSFYASMRIDRGLSGRGFIWGRAWKIFTSYPLLGTGPGTFLYYILSPAELLPHGTVEQIRYMYFQHGDMSLMHVPGIFAGVISNSAHNLWLDMAANTGIVGVVAVVIIFFVFGYFAVNKIQVFKSNKQEPYYWVARGCLVGLIAFFLRSQFEVTGILRGALSESLPFWLTFLLVICVPRMQKSGTG